MSFECQFYKVPEDKRKSKFGKQIGVLFVRAREIECTIYSFGWDLILEKSFISN